MGNLIPGPRHTRVIRGFCSYLIFPILKIKIKKVSGDSIQHRSSPGAGFSKLENTNFFFLSFLLKVSRVGPVDRVRVHIYPIGLGAICDKNQTR